MATVNYYLKGALSDQNIEFLKMNDSIALKTYLNTPLQIILKVSMAGMRIQVYTKKRIEPNYWLKDKQELNCRKHKLGCSELNTWLNDLKKEVNLKCIQLETSSQRITSKDLQLILNKFSVRKRSLKTFTDYIDIFLEEHLTRSGYPLKNGTRKKYKVLVKHLNDFCEKERQAPYVDMVNLEFLKNFQKYLQNDVNHTDNTVVKNLKACKTFFGFLIKKEIVEQIDFSDIKTTESEGEIYTLTIDEILHIQNTDFKNKAQNAARDIFCFQCWTGQRISDILNINWDSIQVHKNNEKTWDFISVKGEERISVPIIKYADRIISKYKNDPLPLPLMSAQKINENLKILGLKANLNRKVRKVKYFKGKIEIDYVPLYTVLTTHVARKSYITNSLILDIPERIVRSISKHKNERSFRRYVEISEEYKNQKIREAFNN